jgi:pimeloyl-ACP methyl ester carboxylesterase
MVCAGPDENWRIVASVEFAAGLAPNSRLEPFEASRHCSTVEAPQTVQPIVRDFVDSM